MLRISACLHALYTPAGRKMLAPVGAALEMAPQERALYLRRQPATKATFKVGGWVPGGDEWCLMGWGGLAPQERALYLRRQPATKATFKVNEAGGWERGRGRADDVRKKALTRPGHHCNTTYFPLILTTC